MDCSPPSLPATTLSRSDTSGGHWRDMCVYERERKRGERVCVCVYVRERESGEYE